MKNYLSIILFAIFAIPSFGQSISLFNLDTTNFPTMKAKFYAFDKDGKQVTTNKNDLKLTENGIERNISKISCPAPKPPKDLSSVLVIDISGSMSSKRYFSTNMEIAKAGASAWVNALPLGTSECAITSFDDANYLNQDFTIDRNLLLNAIQPLNLRGGTRYDAGFIDLMFGGLQISKKGKHQKVIVFLTDGQGGGTENAIIDEANKQNCQVFCVVVGMPAPAILQNIASKTGGLCFDYVYSKEQAEEIYKNILFIAIDGSVCDIEWESDYYCKYNQIKVNLLYSNLSSSSYYFTPFQSLISLNVVPNYIKFGGRIPNMPYDTTITLTAVNSDFTINDFKIRFGSNNFQFVNTSLPFTIQKNNSKIVTLRFTPLDSSLDYTAFNIETNLCPAYFSAYGGFNGKKNRQPTLKLLTPNGKEEYLLGSDTLITWTGVSPQDTVILDYSIDSGKTWKNISNNATGLSYQWQKIPKPTSQRCLVRVSQASEITKPIVEWIKNYGGNNNDFAKNIRQTSDGGYVVIGNSQAIHTWDTSSNRNTGDITNNKGDTDLWVVKTDEQGKIEWENSLGDIAWDYGYSIEQTFDGGFIASGSLDTLIYDKQNNLVGNYEAWIVKLSDKGKLEWEKIYRGLGEDKICNIKQTIDSCYVFIGTARSKELDIQCQNISQKIWVEKIDKFGKKLWSYCSYKYSSEGLSLDIAPDGGFIIGGKVFKIDANSKLNVDCIVIKLNLDGILEWEKTYGGSATDGLHFIKKTNDNSYLFVGESTSNDGDVSKNNGFRDLWIVKIDEFGSILWQKSFGGSLDDFANSVAVTEDGGYIIAGTTYSNDKDINFNHGNSDIWSIKFNDKGEILWQNTFGGTMSDWGNSVIQTNDKGYAICGGSNSSDGDILENRDLSDMVVIKLSPDRQILQQDISDTLFAIVAPAPASKDIDMKQCIVNRIKDSTINDFVINNGKYQFRVDSIYFTGADAGAFSLVSGLPKYNVLGNTNEFAEIRFTPNRVGLHSAKVNIITSTDTLIQNIIGEGIQPSIEILNKYIDFGNVRLGKDKDTLNAVTIKNVGSSKLRINSIVQSGPNLTDFSILSPALAFDLNPGEVKVMDLKFIPMQNGTVNGGLLFNYDGIESPALVQLIGSGIDAKATISADTSSAFTGKENKVNISLTNMDALLSIGIKAVSAELVFNKTMLFPKFAAKKVVESDSLVLQLDSLPLVSNTNNLLSTLKFVATLGNAEETAISIRNVKFIGGDAEATVQNGKFSLLGVCKEGGERFLVGNKSKTMLLSIAPNPATESIEIEYSNADEGEAEFKIYNILGELVITQKLEKTQEGKAAIDLFNLPTGQYYASFTTETYNQNLLITVIK